MSDVITPALRGLLASGEVWDAGTPNSVYRGRINNSRLWTTIGTPTITDGKVGNAYTFGNGSNSQLAIARENAVWFAPSNTISFWLNFDLNAWYLSQALVWFLDFSGNQSIGIRAEVATGRLVFRFVTTNGAKFLYTAAFALSPGWHHFVYQWTESHGTWAVAQVWVDGVKYANSGNCDGTIVTAGLPANVIVNRATIQTDVKIEQLMLFSGHILSDSNVLQIYNGGNGRAFGVHRVIPQEFSNSMIG